MILDHIIEGLCASCRREPFHKVTADGAIDHSGDDERNLLGIDRNPVSKCISFVRSCCCVVLGFISCVLSLWNH